MAETKGHFRCVTRVVAAAVLYLTCSVIYFGLPIITKITLRHLGATGDAGPYVWFYDWWPRALTHGTNPFRTTLLFSPIGANITWAASIPGLSLATTPLTETLGPVASFNVVQLLSPALTAVGIYLLVDRLTGSWLSAVLSGYLVGFSAYMQGHLAGSHPNLVGVFLIPFGVYIGQLYHQKAIQKPITISIITVLLLLQFTISTEIFTSLYVLSIVTLLVLALFYPVDARRLGNVWLFSSLIALCLLTPLLIYMLLHSPPRTPPNSPLVYSNDLLNIIIPTRLTLIGGSTFSSLSQNYKGNLYEQNAYLSVPILMICLFYTWRYWRRSSTKITSLLLIVSTCLSFGPFLHIDGRMIAPLPWVLALVIPFVSYLLPARLIFYSTIASAVLFGYWFSTCCTSARWRCIVTLGIIVIFLPNFSLGQGYWWDTIDVPSFFTDGDVAKTLVKSETVFLVPDAFNGTGMLETTLAGSQFRLAGGYLGTIPSPFDSWPLVSQMRLGFGPSYPVSPEQFREYLNSFHVTTVIAVAPVSEAFATIADGAGLVGSDRGGVILYRFRSPSTGETVSAGSYRRELQLQQFRDLFAAASCYLHGGGVVSQLYPAKLEQSGYLATGYGSFDPTIVSPMVTVFDGWIGPGQGGVEIGVTGQWRSLRPLLDEFGPLAQKIYFPYPRQVTAGPTETAFGRLVMVFRPSDLAAAASSGSVGLRRCKSQGEP